MKPKTIPAWCYLGDSAPSFRRSVIVTFALLAPALGGCLAAKQGVSTFRGAPQQREFTVEMAAVDIPVGGGHHEGPQPEPLWLTSPVSGWVHGFAIELVDLRGDTVPSSLLHHVKLMTPEKRELFEPIMLRLVGAGAETRAGEMPPFLGFPLQAGDSLLATAMLHNPTDRAHDGVRVRIRLHYTAAQASPTPTIVYPFFMHVTPPDQHSGYDLPPGRTTKSWEARPAAAGRILAFGGHLHRFATELRFEDVTTGTVLWRARPKVDARGEVLEVPRKLFIWSRGPRVHPGHVYRLTAVYDNPTADTIYDGGMGTIGGIIQPRQSWPAVDRQDALYIFDRDRESGGSAEHGHGHHGSGSH